MAKLIEMPEANQSPNKNLTVVKIYSLPMILHEFELETRAGSPIGPIPDGIDPLGLTSPLTSP